MDAGCAVSEPEVRRFLLRTSTARVSTALQYCSTAAREHADASALLMLRSVPLEGLQFDVRRLEAALHEVELAHRFADDVERKRA